MKNRMQNVYRIAAAPVVAIVMAVTPFSGFAQQNGPGCVIDPASSSVGADVPESYFAPPPSTVQRELIGPLQLLTAGKLDQRAGTITLPLYRGTVKSGNRTVYYILTDTTDEGNAKALGLNFAPKLNYTAVTSNAVRNAVLLRDGTLEFDAGMVDFTPERRVIAGPSNAPFPPTVAEPGSVGDKSYSPLVRIVNAGGYIYNAPIVAAGEDPSQFVTGPSRTPNYRFVHDKVLSINIDPKNPFGSTVTLRLTTGFSFARPVLYLSLDASAPVAAALEQATLAPGLEDIELGNDDSAFSAIERIFLTVNGPTGCGNPQRQGLFSALVDGQSPLNVLGGIPTVATDYSPLWDANVGEWTQSAVEKGYRSRVTDEFQILGLVQGGFITGPNGSKYGSAGFVINCPIVFRFL